MEVDVKTLLAALPRGGTLSNEAWLARHRAILVLLWAHVACLLSFGVAIGHGLPQTLLEGGFVGFAAALATRLHNPRLQSVLATVGLLASSGLLLHMSGGVIEMHFHFFAVMMIISMYQSWVPFIVAVGYGLVHHGVVGVLDPTAVFNHEDAWRAPWKWATVHVGFILGAGAVAVVHWRMQERAQEEIQRVQRLVGDAFDNAPIGMALVDLKGRWLRVNASVTEITGYSSGELRERTVADITHPDDRDDAEIFGAPLLADASPSHQLETRFVHADGHAVPVLVTMILLRDRSGSPESFMLQLQDVAERKKAEEYYRRLYEGQTALVNELQEAHRLKSELFSIVSHEFRTPLAGIIGFTALLSRKEGGGLTDEQRESHLQTIARQAERLNRLVENLFFTAHQVEPSLDAVANVEDAVTAVRLQIAETYDDIGWETKIAKGLRPRIAQGALGLVLLNLVSNAVKHATPNTDVRVVARDDEGQVAISVTNTGEPIPVEQRERIFEPFVQRDGAARTAEGIGLGLHIVHKLVVAYGGTVSVDSGEHEVTFTIRLPQDPAPSAEQPSLVLSDTDRVA